MSEDSSSSILRGIATLIGLAEAGGPVSFGVLAAALELPPSTAHRILGALRQAGYAVQDPATGSYSPGPAFLRAATLFSGPSAYPQAVQGQLEMLVAQSGESAYYGAYLAEMQRFRFVAQLYSERAVHYVVRKDKNYSLLWGASGRSIAAFLPEKTLKSLFDKERNAEEGNVRLPAWPEFRKEMAVIRDSGYCTTNNQRFEGAHSIAAPIIGAQGTLVGCVGISMPSQRRDEKRIAAFAEHVREASRHLSQVVQCAIEKVAPTLQY
ncbi:MAG: IclR family transcriptional regulator [Pseudomonadota bacterium]